MSGWLCLICVKLLVGINELIKIRDRMGLRWSGSIDGRIGVQYLLVSPDRVLISDGGSWMHRISQSWGFVLLISERSTSGLFWQFNERMRSLVFSSVGVLFIGDIVGMPDHLSFRCLV
jgi:hypothetical protein